MRNALDSFLPADCAALCRAVLIGDKYALSPDTRDHFRYAGASYFIVVSGMHFAVVIMLLFRLMKRLNRWVRFALIMAFIVLYAAVTGFQSSVLRARYHDDLYRIRYDDPTATVSAESSGTGRHHHAVDGFSVRRGRYRTDPIVLCHDGDPAVGESDIAQKLCLKDKDRRSPVPFWHIIEKLEWIKKN